ncbi:MAG: Hpt domain-containing protein [Pseudomonadota bacterium]
MQWMAGGRRKALVVNERGSERDLGKTVLADLNYDVDVRTTAQEIALDGQLRAVPLVVLSSTLPDLGSVDLPKKLHGIAAPDPLRIAIVRPEQSTFELALEGRATIRYLSRPISSGSIRAAVQALEEDLSAGGPEPIIDMDHLLSFTDGDMELESELSVLFLSSAEAYYTNMMRSLSSGTPWKSSVHALKGASANLGARRLAALARAVEHQDPAPADLEEIRQAIDEVSAFFVGRHNAIEKSSQH